jgi:hypothetical protein
LSDKFFESLCPPNADVQPLSTCTYLSHDAHQAWLLHCSKRMTFLLEMLSLRRSGAVVVCRVTHWPFIGQNVVTIGPRRSSQSLKSPKRDGAVPLASRKVATRCSSARPNSRPSILWPFGHDSTWFSEGYICPSPNNVHSVRVCTLLMTRRTLCEIVILSKSCTL